MDTEVVRKRLTEERQRLDGVRSTFDDEHLGDQSESEATGELSSYDQHQAEAEREVRAAGERADVGPGQAPGLA